MMFYFMSLVLVGPKHNAKKYPKVQKPVKCLTEFVSHYYENLLIIRLSFEIRFVNKYFCQHEQLKKNYYILKNYYSFYLYFFKIFVFIFYITISIMYCYFLMNQLDSIVRANK